MKKCNCGSEYFVEIMYNMTTRQKGVRFEDDGTLRRNEVENLEIADFCKDDDELEYECQECGKKFVRDDFQEEEGE